MKDDTKEILKFVLIVFALAILSGAVIAIETILIFNWLGD